MNPEYKRGLFASLKTLWIGFIALFYWLAGRGTKILGMRLRRRWMIPLLIVGGVIAFSLFQGSFSWYYLISIPLYMGAYHVGYGAGSPLRTIFGKVGQRLIVGFLRALACLPIAWINGAWVLFGFQMILAMTSQAVLGTVNPIEAVEEENNICIFDLILVPFMIRWI